MSDNFNGKLVEWHDIAVAFSLLTRLPIPVDHMRAGKRAAAAAWAYPLVGATVGLISGSVGGVLLSFGVATGICAAFVVAAAMLLTGALHEDGIADCADGLAGGMDRDRRLEIMKDSRIGAYGAGALVVVLLARWSGAAAVLPVEWPLAFAVIGAASRLPMVLAMALMPLARKSGLAADVGRPTSIAVGLGVVLTLGICLIPFGASGLVVLLLACLAPLPLWFAAQRAIGGYTGDILGGSQQLAEVAAIATVTALL